MIKAKKYYGKVRNVTDNSETLFKKKLYYIMYLHGEISKFALPRNCGDFFLKNEYTLSDYPGV